MSARMRKYGRSFIGFLRAVTAGSTDFKASPTINVGEVKMFSFGGESPTTYANMTARMRAFTNGSARPSRGDTITGATSGATATVIGAVTTSGTWAGGTAAGFLFVELQTGTFQSENLNNTTTTTNTVMAIGGDTSAGATGGMASMSICFAVTTAEAKCQQGYVNTIDAATKEWSDNSYDFETYGDANAMHAVDFSDATAFGLSRLDAAISTRATAASILTTALTEAYAAAGAAPTLTQLLMYVHQHLRERSIIGTTETVKKLNGSTTAGTNTLNDATNPTGVTATT